MSHGERDVRQTNMMATTMMSTMMTTGQGHGNNSRNGQGDTNLKSQEDTQNLIKLQRTNYKLNQVKHMRHTTFPVTGQGLNSKKPKLKLTIFLNIFN